MSPTHVRANQVGTHAPKKHTPRRKATKKAREAEDERVLSEAMKYAALEKRCAAAQMRAAALLAALDENLKAARQPPPAEPADSIAKARARRRRPNPTP